MCTTRNKILILALILSALPFLSFAQTTEEQLVQDYINTLNAWLKNPFESEAKQFCAIFLKGNNSGIKDQIVQEYNTEGEKVLHCSPRSYLSIFNERNRRQRITVELIGSPIVDKQRKTVTAKIKFSGGLSLITVSDFWIENKKIEGIVANERQITNMRSNGTENAPLPQNIVVDESPATPPKDGQPSKQKDKPSQETNRTNPPKTTPSQPQTVLFHFTSSPENVSVNIDGSYAGRTPLTKALVPGTHVIDASRWRCKDFSKRMELNSYHPDIHIRLKQLLNRKFEIYIEGNYLTGGMTAYGATLGGFLGNFNLEATYYMCLDKSEDIYWCDNERLPVKCNYTPDLIASAKLGYGIRIGTRFRITPQAGANYFTLKEEVENDQEIAQNVNSLNLLGSIRFSFAAAKHLKLSVTPEYHKNFKTSAGFEVLKETSPIIQDWTEGINVKFGLALFF